MVGLITTDTADDPDMAVLIAELRGIGIEAASLIWHQENPWHEFEMLVMKSPWDYHERQRDFEEWLAKVEKLTEVQNPAALIRWNLDKSYLLDLQQEGVEIVPTRIYKDIEQIESNLSLEQVVIKPSVSAGSRNTGWFEPNDRGALNLAREILDQGKQVIVQPFIKSVAEQGEKALVFFGGQLSHAVTKGPLLDKGGKLKGGCYQEIITPASATEQEEDLANRALGAAQRITGQSPLCARIDLVSTPEGPKLLEAELFEPSCFLDADPGAPQRLARAIGSLL